MLIIKRAVENLELSDRKKRLLYAIVNDYIETAEPVGSRTIAKKYMPELSPATIRNEMSDLEDMGYLEQPHSSSGRIPSVLGYRVFVDSLMEKHSLSMIETMQMQEAMQDRMNRFDKLIEKASRAIASLTNYATVAISAGKKKNSIKAVQIVPVSKNEVVAILVTDEGTVKNKLIRTKEECDAVQIVELSSRLTEKLSGHTLNDITLETINSIKNENADMKNIIEEVIGFISEVIGELDSREIIVDGGVNLLQCPEYSNIEKAKEIMEMLSNKEKLQNIVSVPIAAGNKVNVIIGDEQNGIKLKDCSLVLCNYEFGNNEGTIAVIGPTRMDYPKVVSALEYICGGLRPQLEGGKASGERKENS